MAMMANRAEMARLLGVSEPTLDRLIVRGMPVAQRGGNGRPYQFDIEACTAWYRGELDREEADRQARENEFAQFAFDLGNNTSSATIDGVQPGLTGKARIDALNAALLEDKLARTRGDLVPVADVKADYMAIFQRLRQRLLAVDTMLVRRAGLSPAQAAIVRDDMRDLLKELGLQIANPDWRPVDGGD